MDGDLRGQIVSVIHPIDSVDAEGSHELDLLNTGRMARPRLLLADDVGLGKIIEAGILLRDGEFQSLSASHWDVVVVDEAHHLAANRNEDDITDHHRLARWLSEATDALFLLSATPHDGYDESLSSLLELLEPSLVLPGTGSSLFEIRKVCGPALKAAHRYLRRQTGVHSASAGEGYPSHTHKC